MWRNGEKVHLLPFDDTRWEYIPERKRKVRKQGKPFTWTTERRHATPELVRGGIYGERTKEGTQAIRRQVFSDRPNGNGQFTMISARPTYHK